MSCMLKKVVHGLMEQSQRLEFREFTLSLVPPIEEISTTFLTPALAAASI